MPTLDPMALILAQKRADKNQVCSFWRDHLRNLVSAYRHHLTEHNADPLLMVSVKALVEGDNSREDLCYQVMCAVEMMARAK